MGEINNGEIVSTKVYQKNQEGPKRVYMYTKIYQQSQVYENTILRRRRYRYLPFLKRSPLTETDETTNVTRFMVTTV